MPRPIPQHGEPVNGDSFLDIVASVVSIMIIMVVMVGMRIKNSPVTVAIPANPAVTELEKDVATEKSLRADVFKMVEETRQLQQEAAQRGLQRDVLATMVSAVEQKIQERRQKLDTAKQADFDLARGLSEAKFQLDQLHRQREQAANAPAPPVVVESYPTPISRAVDGPEAHLLISNGRVLFVPLEALLPYDRMAAILYGARLLRTVVCQVSDGAPVRADAAVLETLRMTETELFGYVPDLRAQLTKARQMAEMH